MKDTVGTLIEELLVLFKRNYRKPKLWIGVGLVAFCCVLLFPYVDSNFFYFSRMEKRISILERVMELDETKINSNQVYKKEYQSILQEISQQSERSVNSVMNKARGYINDSLASGKNQGIGWLKFFAGAFWFLIITVCVPFMNNTFESRSDKIIAFVLLSGISIIFGWISLIIPIILTPIVNYIGIPVIQIVLISVLVNKSNKKEKEN